MKRLLGASVAAVMAAFQTSPALAQETDDWEFQEDVAQRLSVAAVRYDAGPAIFVQCRQGGLTVVLAGLPATTSGDLVLEARRADGRSDSQRWISGGAPGSLRSSVPARDVRFMRGGGAFTLRSAEGAATFAANYDLPTQSANLDRVLTNCGWAVTEERDLLSRVGDTISLVDPNAQQRRPPQTSRTVTRRPREAQPPQPGAPSGPPPAELQISCIVRNLHLTECRPHQPPSPSQRIDAGAMRRYEGRQVYSNDAAAAEGRVIYLHGGGVVTVIDYISTVPAGG